MMISAAFDQVPSIQKKLPPVLLSEVAAVVTSKTKRLSVDGTGGALVPNSGGADKIGVPLVDASCAVSSLGRVLAFSVTVVPAAMVGVSVLSVVVVAEDVVGNVYGATSEATSISHGSRCFPRNDQRRLCSRLARTAHIAD